MTASPNTPSQLVVRGSEFVESPPTTNQQPPTIPDPRVRLLRDLFFNRTDAVAVRQKKRPPFPIWLPNGDPLKLLQAHVLGKKAPAAPVTRKLAKGSFTSFSGHFRVGSYAPSLDGVTRWLCIDFDGAGHSHPLKDARGAALATVQNFYTKKIPCYLERSGGGQGYHVWVFFEQPVTAGDARTLGFQMVCRDAPLQKGGQANPERGQGIEIFPKQEKVSPKGYGNMVFLPWWSGAPGGANQFYPVTPEGLMGSAPFVPDRFDTLKSEDLDWIIAEVQPEPAHSQCTPSKQDWQMWQEEALKVLPLDAIYGQWLTGETSGHGWLQCRDPFSPTGDQNPSAGVATGEGDARRGSFHSFISGKTLDVFGFLRESGRASTFTEAKSLVADLSGVPFPKGQSFAPSSSHHATSAPTTSANARPSTRLAIQVDQRQFKDLMEETWRVIHALNRPPTLFRRVGGLAIIQREKDRFARINQLNDTEMYGLLGRLCDWERMGAEGEKVPANPPMNIAKDLLAFPDQELPRLEAITQVPLFGKGGQLIASRGYHEEDLLWFEPDLSFHLDPVPDHPTLEQVEAAKSLLLDDLLHDFPFGSDADRSNYLAALLLPYLRRMIDGPTPLHVIEAPTIGSGKTMLCQLISLILTGKPGVITTFPVEEGERRKRITSELVLGRPVIVLDNASEKQKVDSSDLAALLTTQEWSDRVLGQNKMVELDNRAVWLLTGNNPQLSLEIARRSIRIRLAPGTSQPWLRKEFKHKSLFTWARENRPALLHAVLTLIRYWISQGKPLGTDNLGSFEDWAGVMGGLMQAIGVPGFMGNLDSLYEDADGEGGMWAEFTQAWWDAFGATPKKVTDLNDLCEEKNLLGAVRRDGSPRSREIRLGFALARKKDCPCGDFTITPVRKQGKGKTGREYALVKNQEPPSPTRRPGLDFEGGDTPGGNRNTEGDGQPPVQDGQDGRNVQKASGQPADGKLTSAVNERPDTPENWVVVGSDLASLNQTCQAKNPSKNVFCDANWQVRVVAGHSSRESLEKGDSTGGHAPRIEGSGANYPYLPDGGSESAFESITTGISEDWQVEPQHARSLPGLPSPQNPVVHPPVMDLNDPSFAEEDETDGSRAPPDAP